MAMHLRAWDVSHSRQSDQLRAWDVSHSRQSGLRRFGEPALSVGGESATAAGNPSSEQIREALSQSPSPGKSTADMSSGPMPSRAKHMLRLAEEKLLIDYLCRRGAQSITDEERANLHSFARKRPGIDLDISFEYDSAIFTPAGRQLVFDLGQALRDPKFNGAIFLILGHTDSKGTAIYNQVLSERRAEAVRHFLMERFDLPEKSLVSVGYGRGQLKNAANPFAEENRRIEIVNMSA